MSEENYLISLPDSLSSDALNMIRNFAYELGKKMAKAQEKYGFEDDWNRQDWAPELRAKLREHVGKGDPVDVGLYCAFAWHKGYSLAESVQNRTLTEAQRVRWEEMRAALLRDGVRLPQSPYSMKHTAAMLRGEDEKENELPEGINNAMMNLAKIIKDCGYPLTTGDVRKLAGDAYNALADHLWGEVQGREASMRSRDSVQAPELECADLPAVEAMVRDCERCGGDCASANPPMVFCPVQAAKATSVSYPAQDPERLFDSEQWHSLIEDAELFRYIEQHVAGWHCEGAVLPRIVVDPMFRNGQGDVCKLIVTGRDGVGTVSLRSALRIVRAAQASEGRNNG